MLVGGGIDGESRFLQLGGEFRRLDQFYDPHFRSRKQNVESLDVGVETPLLEFGQHPFGVVLVVRRADVMRTGGEALHVVAQVLGLGDGAEFCFPIALSARRCRGITVKRLFGFRRCGQE